MKIIKLCLLLFCLTALVSCGQVNSGNSLNGDRSASFNMTNGNLAETPIPKVIQGLNQDLEQYTPRVAIVSPRKDQILNQTKIDVVLEVKDLPIFKDDKLKLGNHLNLILDNEPSRQIYDVTDPVVLENITPGTHTIRVFATRPWGESFKNDGAYAQTTFSVLTETNDNRPDRKLPLLTYNNPTGTYGAEPFLLDFYLTNAPLHSMAQSNRDLLDWKIKTTVNGDSFFLENWQPVYLTGLNKGKNWIQLELLDEAGNNIENAFNNTVRVIDYDPQQSDTLSKLVQDQISLAEAQPIVEHNYYIQPVGVPEIIEPTVEPEEDIEPNIDSDEPVEKIQLIEEPTVEDKTENKVVVPEPVSQLESSTTSVKDINQSLVMPEKETISDISTNEVEDVSLDNSISKTEELVSNDKPSETITITQVDSNNQTVATIEIPQPESVEITEEEIAITIPEIEPNVISSPESTSEKQSWWKKILVGFRHKLEGLVKLLPSET